MTPAENTNHTQPFRGYCPELNRFCRGTLILEGESPFHTKYIIEEYGTPHEVDPSTVEEINF